MSWYFPVITFLVIFPSFALPCCVSFRRFASSVYHFLVYFTSFCWLSLCAFVFVTFKPVCLFNRTQACYCFSGFLHSSIEYVASLLSPVAIGFSQFHQFCISLFLARPVFFVCSNSPFPTFNLIKLASFNVIYLPFDSHFLYMALIHALSLFSLFNFLLFFFVSISSSVVHKHCQYITDSHLRAHLHFTKIYLAN